MRSTAHIMRLKLKARAAATALLRKNMVLETIILLIGSVGTKP